MLGGMTTRLTALLGGPVGRRLARWRLLVPAARRIEERLASEPDQKLRERALALRYRAKSREPLARLLPETFALAAESAHRTIGLRPYDVQLLGGMAMHFGAIAEMQTGEGKTLTATLPLCLNALSGQGAQLATANDYLAERDANWMMPVYKLLGLSVGVITAPMDRAQRRRAYACDITYGTAKEFGFDFLKDRLLLRASGGTAAARWLRPTGGLGADEQPVQREPHFVIVDEADSLLIDEARTPLIISAAPTEAVRTEAACFQWAAEAVGNFEDPRDYYYDEQHRAYFLTPAGRRLARSLPKPETMNQVPLLDIYEHIERAVRAREKFHRDQQYVIRNGEVVIVDEFTGRLGEGRKWRDGLHQAVEAKEKVRVTIDTGQAARVTVQDFFRRFERVAGMTGTAVSSAREFRAVYHLPVVPIPTHRPLRRRALPELVFGTEAAKWQAIVEEVRRMRADGRPVLIGTRSIDKSEHLSRLLTEAGIEHQVLNARHLAAEAGIVAQAGERGRVTVSTNMAGRGTDIKLGPGVAELGGLHVIVTEAHDSARIDRQLIGRSGRQGDPGSYRMFLALDDEILRTAYSPARWQRLRSMGENASGPMNHLRGQFRKAQRTVERRHYRDRKILLFHEEERKKVQLQMGLDPYLDTVA
jgi:preprotein translocase subunit SecA